MDSLKDLLGEAIHRKKLNKQVLAGLIVREMNLYLDRNFLGQMRTHIHALSFRNGVLVLGCLNSAVSHAAKQREEYFLDEITRAIPSANISQVVYRIMDRFPEESLIE
jgi:hypothetical protein